MRAAAALLLTAWGCGAAGPSRVVAPRGAEARAPAPRAPADAAALDALRAAVASGERAALEVVGVELARAGGATEMTGESAPDERVVRAAVVARDGDDAALLVATTCGNATLAGLRWDGARWARGARVALVEGMAPGRCARTEARAEALALASDARRDVAVVVQSEDATGDSVRGPFLSVYQLGARGALAPLLAEAPFGANDDATGATSVGSYLVVEEAPAPRDLHVSIRPGRLGPGGPPPNEVVRRRYALRGGRLELVEQATEAAE